MTVALPTFALAAGVGTGLFMSTVDHPWAGLVTAAMAGLLVGLGLSLAGAFAARPGRPGKADMVRQPGAHARFLARRAARPTVVAASFGVGLVASAPWWTLTPLLLAAAAVGLIAGTRVNGPGAIRARQALAGARAEERVAYTLTRLPGVHVVVNSVLLGAGGDLDHAVVSRQGLVAVETKHGRGALALRDGRVCAGGKAIPGDPVAQVRRQAAALQRITGRRVTALVCIPDGIGVLRVGEVTVCGLRDLGAHLGVGSVLDASAVQAIVTRIGAQHRHHQQIRRAA